ncbi:11760_t:CDS:2, partial [Diversispora eburnea]
EPRNKELKGLTQVQDPNGLNSSSSLPPENAGDDNEAFNNPVCGAQMPLITKLIPGGPEGNFHYNACFDKLISGDLNLQGSDCNSQINVCKSGAPVFSA